jgi:diacylglycerol kinase family enzyme
MRLAVVVNVGNGPTALQEAVDTQKLLLDRLGTRLDSIRLAVPRLLHFACASAIAEKPDALAVVGGARSTRRAGQLAHEHGVPILFLPGLHAPQWVRQLWGPLSLEEMARAFASGQVKTIRLGAGAAGNQLFFQQAECGLLPHLPELREAFDEADMFADGWQVLARAADVLGRILRPQIRFHAENAPLRRAAALVLAAGELRTEGTGRGREDPRPVLRCTAYRYGIFGYARALVRGSLGADWRGGDAEHFESLRLTVEARKGSWILLDGEPLRFDAPIEFRFIPGAVETFGFTCEQLFTKENATSERAGSRNFATAAELEWNFPSPSHVAKPTAV